MLGSFELQLHRCSQSKTAPKCFSSSLFTFVLGVVRPVLRGREVVWFGFSNRKLSRDKVQVQSFGDGAVLPSLFDVSNVDNFCNSLLEVVLGLAALLQCSASSVDVTPQSWRLYLEQRKSFFVR